MKKLKGIKFKNTDGGYGYGPVAPAKECPPGTMHDRTRGGACVDIELLKKEGKLPYTPLDDYGYTPEPRLPEPTSQADCPNGTIFAPSYVGCPPGWPTQLGCQPRKQPARCVDTPTNECPEGYDLVISQEPPDFCQQYYSQGKPCPRIMPSRKCVKKDVSGTVQENVQNSLQSLMDNNWLLPAIAIGVGVYLITRKS